MKLLLTLLLLIIVVFSSCKTLIISSSKVMYYAINTIFNLQQLDSLCKADVLPTLLNWQQFPIQDYESNRKFYEYLYVYNDSIYRIEYYSTDSIKIIKRIYK